MVSYMRTIFLTAWIVFTSSDGSAAFAPASVSNWSQCPSRDKHGTSHAYRKEDDDATAMTTDRKTFVANGVATIIGVVGSTALAPPTLAITTTSPPPTTVNADVVVRTTLAALNRKSTTPVEVLSGLRSTHRSAPYAKSGNAVVTGGNTGIGLETVKILACAGMNVILCSRNVGKGLDARDTLPEELRSQVSVQKLDLADMQSVRDATNDILKNPFVAKGGLKGGGIDLIVNNAGVIDKKGDKQYSAQGLELTFAINHVGHHMLTRDLLPSVNQGGRVTTVSSLAHGFANVEKAVTGANGYAGSKLCNILFAKSLQDRLDSIGRSDVKSVSLHPGVIATSIFDNTAGLWPLVALSPDRDTEQGASTASLCSLADNEIICGGEFYSNCAVTKPSDAAIDARGELRERVWALTETTIAAKGFTLPATLA